jgi:hypothetical protein
MTSIMKTKILSLTTIFTVMSGASLLAMTQPQTQTANAPAAPVAQFETVAFSDSAEAGMMHRAYRILAFGDHDYHGHRAKAMDQVKKAAALLGLDLRGDDRDHTPQVLSDDKLREARGLLQNIRDSAEVKDQKRITKHLQTAIDEINTGLSVH